MVNLEAVRGAPAGNDGDGGVQVDESGAIPSGPQANAVATIVALNEEFRQKTDELLALPLALLVEQRDRAVIALEEANHSLETQRATLQAEQDTFIAFLMEDHQKGLVALEQQLSQAKQSLERQAVLSPVIAAPAPSSDDSELRRSLTQAEEHIATLREQLENAYREVDESRSDGWRLQEERDEAIRNTDDIRNELLAEVDGSRDEIAKLEQSLDEANRALEDARDEAREETSRILEELESARNECDERRAEVTRLRERLEGGQSDYRASVPPPPPQNDELELARAEAKVVRKQLIDTKRELSRLSRELELARAQRGPLHRVTPTGGFRPNTRTGTTQPGLNSGGEGPGSRRSGEPPGSKRTVTGSVGKRPDDRKPGTE